jgi:hypothetical protein
MYSQIHPNLDITELRNISISLPVIIITYNYSIIPETDHKLGYDISMEDAPMANRHVQFALRDAQYTTLGEARAQMDRIFALKAKLTTDKATLVYPKKLAAWHEPMGIPGSKLPGSSSVDKKVKV